MPAQVALPPLHRRRPRRKALYHGSLLPRSSTSQALVDGQPNATRPRVASGQVAYRHFFSRASMRLSRYSIVLASMS